MARITAQMPGELDHVHLHRGLPVRMYAPVEDTPHLLELPVLALSVTLPLPCPRIPSQATCHMQILPIDAILTLITVSPAARRKKAFLVWRRSIHRGSCDYGYLWSDEPLGWDVAAMTDFDPDYTTSCG